MKLHYPATHRNRDAILAVLQDRLPDSGRILEIASGSGEHVVHFAAALPDLTFQPSTPDAAERASVDAHARESHLSNVLPALDLDTRAQPWPVPAGSIDAIMCANMIHIAPFEAAVGLFHGAARVLTPDGVFFLYGPFSFSGKFTSDSNAAFDASLKSRDPSWGVRDVDDLDALGAEVGLVRVETIAMPANNHVLVWRRG